MSTFAQFSERFGILSDQEKLHIQSYKEYLKEHGNDNKSDYITDVFVSDKFIAGKKITTMNHDRFSTPNYHSHRFMEINYILEGDFINIIEGQEILMHKGDICVLPPFIFHSMDIVSRDIEIRKNSYAIHLFINTSSIGEFFADITNESFAKFINGVVNNESHRKFALLRCNDPSVSEWITKLLYYSTQLCNKNSTPENLVLSSHLAHTFIAEMLNPERYSLSFSNSFAGASSSTNDIIGYISENFRTVTLENVAEKFNYSFSYTSKLIKQRTGLGFSKMLSNIRLEKTCELLKNTDYPVQDIASKCGYNNTEHFHRSFKAKYGVTPSNYREKKE